MADRFIQGNLSASTAPGVTDDEDAGYEVFSAWVDTTNGAVYFCADATAGAAVWLRANNRTVAEIFTAIQNAGQTLILGAGTTTVAPFKLTAGNLLSTPVAGSLEFDGASLNFTPIGDRRSVNLANGVVMSSVTVADTVTETTIYTETLSPDELYKGGKFHTRISGFYSTANASDTFTFRLNVGATTVDTIVSTAKNVTNGFWRAEFFFTVRSVGVSGTIQAATQAIFDDESKNVVDTSVKTIDTTSSENITATVQWDNANPNNTLTINQGHTDIFGVQVA